VRVGLFITCFNDTLFPETGRATVEVLERLGHEAAFPEAQTCCGQMHFNTGYQREAIPLVRRFVEIFEPYEAVVAPSGSCVGMVRDLYPMAADLAGDADLARRIEDLAPRVFELSEFLVKRLGVTDVGAYYPHRVTYHPTCHSLRMLKVGEAPLELLRNVRGMDLVGLGEAEQCCGFGGTFAVKNAETSAAMLGDKIRRVLDTEAEVCTSAAASGACRPASGPSTWPRS
jgi:L-lactate dehydrogenase complex protein LldE